MLNFFKFFKDQSISDFNAENFKELLSSTPSRLSISVNGNYYKNSFINHEFDLYIKKDVHSFKCLPSGDLFNLTVFKNNHQLLDKKNMSPSDFIFFNQYLKKSIDEILFLFTSQLKSMTPDNFKETVNDEKALEWIRVSFKLLKNAIESSFKDDKLLYQAKLFMDINENKLPSIRFIIFSLDIHYKLLDDNGLEVQIYNHKDGQSTKADLKGVFYIRNKEIFNELIELIAMTTPTFLLQ